MSDVVPNKVESNIPRWPGYIVLPNFMTFPQLSRYQKALDAAKKMEESDGLTSFYETLLPMAFDIVKEWHIEGLPDKVDIDSFPASSGLVGWLVEAISALFTSTNSTDPNSPAQS
jgi:hypothetical protein